MSDDELAQEESRFDDLLRSLGHRDNAEVRREIEASREYVDRRLEFLLANEQGNETGAAHETTSAANPLAKRTDESSALASSLRRTDLEKTSDHLDNADPTGHVQPDRHMTSEVRMNDSLDALLARSAPPTTPSTAQLSTTLNFLVGDTEQRAGRRRRRPARLFAGAALAAATFGAGAAANAAGLLPHWGPSDPSARHVQVMTSAAGDCTATYAVTPLDDNSAAAADAMIAAQRFLATFDTDGIDVAAAVDDYSRATADTSGPDSAGPDTRTQVQVLAIGAELYARLKGELEARGIDPALVTITSFDNCDYGSQP